VIGAAVAVAAVGLWTLDAFVAPRLAASLVQSWAERHALIVEGETWEVDLTSLEIVGHDVTFPTERRFREPYLLKVRELRIDLDHDYGVGALFTARPLRDLAAGGADALSVHVRRIALREGEILLEQPAEGSPSWEPLRRALGAAPAESVAATSSDEAEPWPIVEAGDRRAWSQALTEGLEGRGPVAVIGEDLELALLQSAGDAEGTGSLRRTLALDDVRLAVAGLAGPRLPGLLGTRFALEGWTPDGGRLSAAGQGDPRGSSPELLARVHVESVSPGLLAWTVPDAALRATGGRMTGAMDVHLQAGHLAAHADVALEDVTWAPNPTSPLMVERPESQKELTRALQGLQVSRNVAPWVEGDLADPRFRPLAVMHQQLTAGGLADAPPGVRTAASSDLARIAEDLTANAVDRLAREVANELGAHVAGALGDAAGAAVSNALGDAVGDAVGNALMPHVSSGTDQADEGLKRGFRGMARGLRRLFGGN
jgi:hypothetical protein